MKKKFITFFACLLIGGFTTTIKAQTSNQQKETKTDTKYQSPSSLEGRLATKRPMPHYTCNESGRVVVSIVVNRAGKVTKATPGATGSTTKAKCLLKACKKAALNTTWEIAPDAPEEQHGKITYNFSLH